MIRCSYSNTRLADIVDTRSGQGSAIKIHYTGRSYGLETVANQEEEPKEVLNWSNGAFILTRVEADEPEDVYLCQETVCFAYDLLSVSE